MLPGGAELFCQDKSKAMGHSIAPTPAGLESTVGDGEGCLTRTPFTGRDRDAAS